MNWELLAQLAQILEGVAVLAAISFGYVQLKQFKQQRGDTAAVELMRSVHDNQFLSAFQLIYSLPVEESASIIRQRGKEYEDAAFLICSRFETFGLLSHRGSIPFDMVEELIGGAVVSLWNHLKPWAETLREEQNHPQMFEWCQWLAEQLEAHGSVEEVPAFTREKAWVSGKG